MEKKNHPVLRRFRLIKEYEDAIKGISCNSKYTISYGLADPEDRSLSKWNGTIIGPNGTWYAGKLYNLSITTGPNYPNEAPIVQFITMINLPSVDRYGSMKSNDLLKNWSSDNTIDFVLKFIVDEMERNKKLSQPREGSTY